MGDGTVQNPYTREDVLKAIEENGGTAKGLDLSGKVFEEGIDLSGLDLYMITLNDTRLFRAVFNGSNLYGAIFDNADLQYAKFNFLNSEPTNLYLAKLRGAHLENAEFRNADLSGAEFYGSIEKSLTIAHLDNTDLRGAKLFLAKFEPCFFYSTKLEGTFFMGSMLNLLFTWMRPIGAAMSLARRTATISTRQHTIIGNLKSGIPMLVCMK